MAEASEEPHTVRVLYKYVDGAHFFVSDDKKAIGLCVADKDLKKAFDEVSRVLEVLFRENHGEEVRFTPRTRFPKFREQISKSWPGVDKPKTPAYAVTPAAGLGWKLAA